MYFFMGSDQFNDNTNLKNDETLASISFERGSDDLFYDSKYLVMAILKVSAHSTSSLNQTFTAFKSQMGR